MKWGTTLSKTLDDEDKEMLAEALTALFGITNGDMGIDITWNSDLKFFNVRADSDHVGVYESATEVCFEMRDHISRFMPE